MGGERRCPRWRGIVRVQLPQRGVFSLADITISIRDNGPYLVRGGVTVTDAEGKSYEVQDVIALCRCGHSGRKPFCDGTHKTTGFESAPRAE